MTVVLKYQVLRLRAFMMISLFRKLKAYPIVTVLTKVFKFGELRVSHVGNMHLHWMGMYSPAVVS